MTNYTISIQKDKVLDKSLNKTTINVHKTIQTAQKQPHREVDPMGLGII